MKILNNILLTAIFAILLPVYMVTAVWWRCRYQKWIWASPLRYAASARDPLLFAIDWALWVLIYLIVSTIWS